MVSVVVYMPLEDEGADCWRPVHADHLHDDVYEITVDEEPGGEHWRFPPRSLVRCREHTFDDGVRGLLAFAPATVPHG
jgi:hypothetical protein